MVLPRMDKVFITPDHCTERNHSQVVAGLWQVYAVWGDTSFQKDDSSKLEPSLWDTLMCTFSRWTPLPVKALVFSARSACRKHLAVLCWPRSCWTHTSRGEETKICKRWIVKASIYVPVHRLLSAPWKYPYRRGLSMHSCPAGLGGLLCSGFLL